MGRSCDSSVQAIDFHYQQIYAFKYSDYKQRMNQELAEFINDNRRRSKKIENE